MRYERPGKEIIMLTTKIRLQFLGVVIFLTSCTIQEVPSNPPITLSEIPVPLYVLETPVTIRTSNSTATHLKASTTWELLGSIPQGNVYGTRDQVVIINESNGHEAFIVVYGNKVVGYYLPVEKTFVKSQPVNIKLTKKMEKRE